MRETKDQTITRLKKRVQEMEAELKAIKNRETSNGKNM